MRVVSWLFVLFTMIGAVAVFLPAVELQAGGRSVARRTRVSLYTASGNREVVGRLIAAYHRSDKRQTGARIVNTVAPKVRGKVKAALDDVRDAMETLDDTSDSDVRAAGLALTISLWTLLGLDALTIVLVLRQLVRGSYRGSRLVTALLLTVVIAVIAVALHLVCREAVWEANDEIGKTLFALAPGAYLIPLGAIAGLITAGVLVVRQARRSRDGALGVAHLAR